MSKPPPHVDVLVLGDHPSAYLAAILLQRGGKLSVAHARIPGEESPDRLVLLNPELFDVDESLRSVKRRLDLTSVYGLNFLADEAGVRNGCIRKTIGAYVASLRQIHDELAKLAKQAGVVSYSPKSLQIQGLDESGLDIAMSGGTLRARLLVLAGELPPDQRKLLGLPPWAPESMYRYTFLQIKGSSCNDLGKRPVVPMSLNLQGTHHWAWLLPGKGHVQLAIEQPLQTDSSVTPAILLHHWIGVLMSHEILKPGADRLNLDRAITLDIPLAGALVAEGVANRTLCIGPAGGFFTACAEDVYPGCWSALCAAEVIKSALRERHLQDALQAYRQRWGATLGDYLRGPQTNLRFLLPLVYRNATMASRLTDAILFGKSVVR